MKVRAVMVAFSATVGLSVPGTLRGRDIPLKMTVPVRVAWDGSLGLAGEGPGIQPAPSIAGAWGDVVLRIAQTSELPIFSEPAISAGDVALLYGLRRSLSRRWLEGALGPGHVSVGRRGAVEECVFVFFGHEWIESNVVGLAAQAEAVSTPWSAFGLGIKAFANLNRDPSFGGSHGGGVPGSPPIAERAPACLRVPCREASRDRIFPLPVSVRP